MAKIWPKRAQIWPKIIPKYSTSYQNWLTFGLLTVTKNVLECNGKNVTVSPIHFHKNVPKFETVTETHGLSPNDKSEYRLNSCSNSVESSLIQSNSIQSNSAKSNIDPFPVHGKSNKPRKNVLPVNVLKIDVKWKFILSY